MWISFVIISEQRKIFIFVSDLEKEENMQMPRKIRMELEIID